MHVWYLLDHDFMFEYRESKKFTIKMVLLQSGSIQFERESDGLSIFGAHRNKLHIMRKRVSVIEVQRVINLEPEFRIFVSYRKHISS